MEDHEESHLPHVRRGGVALANEVMGQRVTPGGRTAAEHDTDQQEPEPGSLDPHHVVGVLSHEFLEHDRITVRMAATMSA